MELTPTLLADDADALRSLVRGRVATPLDPHYEGLCASWNLTVEQRPSLVLELADADDAVAALTFARERQMTVAVQNTGHGAGEACAGGLLVRTERLREVAIDPRTRVARVGGGARWVDVLPAAHEAGLAPLSGFNAHVGVVGYALGGGLGWLGRKHGLAVDSVRALDVVLPDGTRTRVTPEAEPDLFWALRGAGSNFGAVLGIEIELVPVTEGLFGGAIIYPGERAAEAIAAYADWIETLPEEVTSACSIVHVPPDADAPEPLRGRTVALLSACVLGDPARAADLLAPIRTLGEPLADFLRPLTIADLGAVTIDPVDPLPAHGHSAIVSVLDDDVQRLVAATADADQPFAVVELRHLGGALARPGVPGPIARPSGDVLVHAEVLIPPGAVGIAADAALSRLATRLRPLATGEMLPSFLGECETGPERIAQAYTAEGRRRLATLKRRYDPDHRFRFGRCVDLSWALD